MRSGNGSSKQTAFLTRTFRHIPLPYAGFQPLRKGKIHVYCHRCGRKQSNMERTDYDPPSAVLVHTECIRCGNGAKEATEIFWDAYGRQISWEAIERHIRRVEAARARSPSS